MRNGEGSDDGDWAGCVVVPPFLKYAAGPLLGPALLAGACESRGLTVHTVDLNLKFIRSTGLLTDQSAPMPLFYGDHSKPPVVLDGVERRFWDYLAGAIPREFGMSVPRLKRGWYSHRALSQVLESLAHSTLYNFMREKLEELPRTRFFGVSMMWAGQIIPALIASKIVKSSWSDVKVVWGGAHVTAIIDGVANDRDFGGWVDGFLPGHCESSFAELVLSVSEGRFCCPGLVIPGHGRPMGTTVPMIPPPEPRFSELHLYGYPKLTLPIELSVGCPYARCSFCTYPAIEGRYLRFPLDTLRRLIELAEKENAAISFKDSLIPASVLRSISRTIDGRLEWSACTKLASNLDFDLLSLMARSGCRTLEVGLESLKPETQARIDKIQPMKLLENFLQAATSAGVSVVINYITGFPWEDPAQAEEGLLELRKLLTEHPNLTAKIEHNRFALERLSPMAAEPSKYGMEITGIWPWSSILEWNIAPQLEREKITQQPQYLADWSRESNQEPVGFVLVEDREARVTAGLDSAMFEAEGRSK